MKTDALRDTWLMFQKEKGCSVDRMLCDPQLRAEFVSAAKAVADCDSEQQLLWAVVGLRKKKTLPAVLR